MKEKAPIKKHMMGGTMHLVMIAEVKRALAKFSGEDQSVEKAALEMGITPRTLRVWMKDWPELNDIRGSMEKVIRAVATKSKKKTKKSSASASA